MFDPFDGCLRKALKQNKFEKDTALIFHQINRVRPIFFLFVCFFFFQLFWMLQVSGRIYIKLCIKPLLSNAFLFKSLQIYTKDSGFVLPHIFIAGR